MAKVQGHVSPTPSAVLNHQVLPLPAVPNPTSENLRPADVTSFTARQSLPGRRVFPDHPFPYRLSVQTSEGQ